jgi:hypothetical protein
MIWDVRVKRHYLSDTRHIRVLTSLTCTGVTKAWGDIYRYVASTVWGQAAGLKDLAQKFKYPIYQKQEHAFAAVVRPKSAVESKYLSDDDDAPGPTKTKQLSFYLCVTCIHS